MKLSIGETASMFGISVRTLRYYDSIGLLAPSYVSDSGYRYYTDAELALLEQILFYRELGFALEDINDILTHPDYDRTSTLIKHRALLLSKRQNLDRLIKLVDETIGGNIIMNQSMAHSDTEELKEAYAAEVRQRWGKTPEYAQNEVKHRGYTSKDEERIASEAEEIFDLFASNMDKDPDNPTVQAIVKRWQEHIIKYHYECTKQILCSLGLMYANDERFTKNLDKHGDGTAQFMSEAIAHYCKS